MQKMSKVFIITEQELNEYNSAKQLQILAFISEESQNNPQYDITTLISLAQQKVSEYTGVWNYDGSEVEELNDVIVETSAVEEAFVEEEPVVETIDELVIEEPVVEESITEEPVVNELDFEEEEEELVEDENSNVTYRGPIWKGLFSEAGKLDKIN
jgi:hypothetical protein